MQDVNFYMQHEPHVHVFYPQMHSQRKKEEETQQNSKSKYL